MFLSWNGNDSGCRLRRRAGSAVRHRMGSRDTTGERSFETAAPGYPIYDEDSWGDLRKRDRIADAPSENLFNGTGGWPNYQHPGAMQVVTT